MKQIKIDTFLEYNFLSALSLSPDKKHTAFIISKACDKENNYSGDIHLMNNETKKTIQLTSITPVRSFFWLNETVIVFSALRDEAIKEKIKKGQEITCFYSIDITGGEAQEYLEIDLSVLKLDAISEDEFLLSAFYDNNRPSLENLTDEEKEKVLKEYKENEVAYSVFEEIPFWSNGRGVVNRKRNRLYIYNKATKAKKAITSELFATQNYKTNKEIVVYTGLEYEDMLLSRNALYLYNINTNTTEKLIDDDVLTIRNFEIYNDKVVLIATDNKDFGMNQNSNFYILDIKTKEVNLLKEHGHTSIGMNSTNSDARYGSGKNVVLNGDDLYYLTTELNNSYLQSINLKTKEITKHTCINAVDCFDIIDEKIMLIGQEENTLTEVYTMENNKEKRLTEYNAFVAKDYSLSQLIPQTVKNRADMDIHGFVMQPINYKKGNSYPAILHIHGGPKTVFSDIFHNEMQLWANNGYFVFFLNPRGSDGRGNEFADIRGKYGTIDYEDIMDFTNGVLEKYTDIDKNRVGVTGGSYGGYMTNWIITQTDFFKVACAQRSISNWTTMEGTSDIGYYFAADQTAASHTTNWQKQYDQSPLKYANKAKTPTLFIHAQEDYRCWMVEALQMFTALKMNGTDTKVCLIKGENHELSRSGKPRNRIKRMQEILDWMDKYLK